MGINEKLKILYSITILVGFCWVYSKIMFLRGKIDYLEQDIEYLKSKNKE